jgi:hypothetical protein
MYIGEKIIIFILASRGIFCEPDDALRISLQFSSLPKRKNITLFLQSGLVMCKNSSIVLSKRKRHNQLFTY